MSFDNSYRFGEPVPEEFMGDIEYMPPEILKKNVEGSKPWSHDIWSLGVILLEISTGIPVFENQKSRIELYRNKTAISVGAFGKAPKIRAGDGTVLACKHDIL